MSYRWPFWLGAVLFFVGLVLLLVVRNPQAVFGPMVVGGWVLCLVFGRFR